MHPALEGYSLVECTECPAGVLCHEEKGLDPAVAAEVLAGSTCKTCAEVIPKLVKR
jgi:hypothetical protein